MIYEVIRKMSWNKFQCWNALLRPYVEIVRSCTVLKNNAITFLLKNTLCHQLQPRPPNGAVPKVIKENWVRNINAEKGEYDVHMWLH